MGAFGVTFLIWVWGGVSFQAYDGWPTGPGFLVLCSGVAVAVWAAGFRTAFEKSAAWFALNALGFAAFLHLVEAGPIVRYQKLLLPKVWEQAQLPGVALVLLQLLGVSAGLFRVLGQKGALQRASQAMPGRWGWRWVLALGAVCAFSANELWKTLFEWLLEMGMVFGISLLNLANLVLIAKALPQAQTQKIIALIEAPSSARLDPFAKGAALWCALVSLFLGWFSYDWHPHIPDEVVYLFHARYFAQGQLFAAPPLVPEAFAPDLLLSEPTRWFCPVPPGWPAILAIGVKLGVPWLVNPLLAAVCVLLLFALVRRIFGLREARWSVLLLSLSPWFLFVSMSVMTHNTSLVLALFAAWCVAKIRDGGHLGYAAFGGMAIGGVSLVRPLEGALVALLLGLWCLIQRGPSMGRLVLRSAVLTLSTIAVGALVLPYNKFFTGDAFYFPIMAYADRVYTPGSNNLGFGPDRGMGWRGLDPRAGHDLRDMALNTNVNVFAVNVELLGWATGSILPLALATFAPKPKLQDLWMLSVIVAISGVHGLYWFSGGPDFGARYWYLVLAPCIVLSARGVLGFADRLEPLWTGAKTKALGAALAACLLSMLVFMPWRVVDKYHNYRGAKSQFYDLLKEKKVGGGLVLLYGDKHPDYGPAMYWNPLEPKEDLSAPLVARDHDLEISKKVIDAYPRRKVWLLDGPTVTKTNYQVLKGPLSSAEAKMALERIWRRRKASP